MTNMDDHEIYHDHSMSFHSILLAFVLRDFTHERARPAHSPTARRPSRSMSHAGYTQEPTPQQRRTLCVFVHASDTCSDYRRALLPEAVRARPVPAHVYWHARPPCAAPCS